MDVASTAQVDTTHAPERGLSSTEAQARLRAEGPNDIERKAGRGTWSILWGQVANTTIAILAVATILSLVLREYADAAAVGAILVLNTVLGFVQDVRSQRAIEALRQLATPTARARRDGEWLTVSSRDLVTGDLVAVEAGNIVPADLRLVESVSLAINESLLTGESVPSQKSVMQVTESSADIVTQVTNDVTPLGDRHDVAFKGTIASAGRGTGVVTATGMRTELGRVASMLEDEGDRRTPLQQRLSRLGTQIGLGVVVLGSVIFGIGLLRGESPALMFMTALSLAVAAIPEALPAVVTISLALGAHNMVRRHALVRHLPAVETLGSVTYVCTDKTGTLTENRMRVESALAGAELVNVLHERADDDELACAAYDVMALANAATLGHGGHYEGDPTETALAEAAAAAEGRVVRELLRIGELPFSPERARMTTLHAEDDAVLVCTKGAPERVLDGCRDALSASGVVALDRERILAAASELAHGGLRVLALSWRRMPELPANLEDAEREQTFVALAGLLDPPRALAAESIALCRSAGIRVVMMTGDHPGTALAIARRVGLASSGEEVVTGRDLAAMNDAQLDERVGGIVVYARVAPEDKLRVVGALQRAGELVAMTGDGVNDAPALQRADIGVAMGRSGTDVAREASDMVLLDDDFSTIVNAVREGRRVHDNIRRFVRYGLATNSGEILAVSLAPLLGLPLPLAPIQILWMNLVTDGLPGLALAAEPADEDAMRRPPLPPGEGVLARGLWQHAAWVGVLMAALALGTQAYGIRVGNPHWQAMTFTVLTFAQLAHVLAIRSERRSVLQMGVLSNRPLAAAVALTIGLQLLVLGVPALRSVLRTTALSPRELLACCAIACVVLVAVELDKWRLRAQRRTTKA